MGNKNSSRNKKLERNSQILDTTKELSEFSNLLLIISKKLIKMKNKKLNELEIKRKEIVTLLKEEIMQKTKKNYFESSYNSFYEKAKIFTEFMLRDESFVKAYELLAESIDYAKSLASNILDTTVKEFNNYNNCTSNINFNQHSTPSEDVRHIIDTVVYSSIRIEIEEFVRLRQIIKNRFGALYLENASIDAYKKCDNKIFNLLSLESLATYTVIQKLNSIALEEKIEISLPEEWFKDALNLNIDERIDLNNINENCIDIKNLNEGTFIIQ